jgi:hypothetical protein
VGRRAQIGANSPRAGAVAPPLSFERAFRTGRPRWMKLAAAVGLS